MPYKIKVWVPVDVEDPTIFSTKEEVDQECEHLSFLQPENKYSVVEVDEGGEGV